MNRYSNSRPLFLIIGVLLISNIVLLILFLNKKPEIKPETRGRFVEFLRRDVGFQEEQIKEYESLKDGHRQKMKILFDELQKTKANFFLQLREADATTANIDSAAALIGERQAALDKQIYYHFGRLRTLCNPAQLQKFDSLFPQVIKRMTSGGQGKARSADSKEKK